MNGTSAVKIQLRENTVWIAQMLMILLENSAGGEAFHWIMALILFRRNKYPEKWYVIQVEFTALSGQLSFHYSIEKIYTNQVAF